MRYLLSVVVLIFLCVSPVTVVQVRAGDPVQDIMNEGAEKRAIKNWFSSFGGKLMKIGLILIGIAAAGFLIKGFFFLLAKFNSAE